MATIYSLSICGRVTLDMHSLNNEGGEGNQITTRMVNIVAQDGKLYNVNAISGDMFKHIQAEHLYRLSKGILPLCTGCQVFSGSRILDDDEFKRDVILKRTAKRWQYPDREVVERLLRRCTIDDLEGVLIAPERGQQRQSTPTEGEGERERPERAAARSIPRKSVAEFGWVVGLPDITTTDSYFHVRYAAERGGEEPTEQPIFHRPASSGVYAAVATFEISRIGFNDITQIYAISDEERERRHKTLLESILYTFIEPNGAMRGTQNPHIVAFEGAVTVSTRVMPAPTLSPLNPRYREELDQVAAALNQLKPGALTIHRFDSMGQFAEVMKELITNSTPFKFAAV